METVSFAVFSLFFTTVDYSSHSLSCVNLRKFAHLFLLLNEACVLHSQFLNKCKHIPVFLVNTQNISAGV